MSYGNYCEACNRQKRTLDPGEELMHVTVHVEIFSTTSRRVKTVQFWLCTRCEKNNRIFLENRMGREARVAKALTPTPVWMKAPGD